MKEQMKEVANLYRGLPKVLHGVRWTQHLLAIIAEVLILASFAMSGLDVNVSGIMTNIGWLKWTWGAAFALGIDTSFVIAWVRVGRCATVHKWGALSWNLALAFGMSFIVFQPVAIQMLQQSLSISFNQALSDLGINIVILVYARAIVAVVLGAVLALTNVESAMEARAGISVNAPKRRLILFDKVLDKIAPVVSAPNVPTSEPISEQVASPEENISVSGTANTDQTPDVQQTEPEDEREAITESLPVVSRTASTSPNRKRAHSPRKPKPTGLASKRVYRVLKASPDATLTSIAQKANVSRGYASQIRAQFLSEQQETSPESIAQ